MSRSQWLGLRSVYFQCKLEGDIVPSARAIQTLENQIASWTAQRDSLTAQIQSILESAEFNGVAINEQEAKQLISLGQALLDQASTCASNPGRCAF